MYLSAGLQIELTGFDETVLVVADLGSAHQLARLDEVSGCLIEKTRIEAQLRRFSGVALARQLRGAALGLAQHAKIGDRGQAAAIVIVRPCFDAAGEQGCNHQDQPRRGCRELHHDSRQHGFRCRARIYYTCAFSQRAAQEGQQPHAPLDELLVGRVGAAQGDTSHGNEGEAECNRDDSSHDPQQSQSKAPHNRALCGLLRCRSLYRLGISPR